MGLLSIILGIFGFGIGTSIGLVIGYYMFIYFLPTHVEVCFFVSLYSSLQCFVFLFLCFLVKSFFILGFLVRALLITCLFTYPSLFYDGFYVSVHLSFSCIDPLTMAHCRGYFEHRKGFSTVYGIVYCQFSCYHSRFEFMNSVFSSLN